MEEQKNLKDFSNELKGVESENVPPEQIDINGYAEDVKQNKEEIYPLLKSMVDTGVLDVGHLSPELRLGMIMTSLAINRMEVNKIEGSNNFLGEASVDEQSDY